MPNLIMLVLIGVLLNLDYPNDSCLESPEVAACKIFKDSVFKIKEIPKKQGLDLRLEKRMNDYIEYIEKNHLIIYYSGFSTELTAPYLDTLEARRSFMDGFILKRDLEQFYEQNDYYDKHIHDDLVPIEICDIDGFLKTNESQSTITSIGGLYFELLQPIYSKDEYYIRISITGEKSLFELFMAFDSQNRNLKGYHLSTIY